MERRGDQITNKFFHSYLAKFNVKVAKIPKIDQLHICEYTHGVALNYAVDVD